MFTGNESTLSDLQIEITKNKKLLDKVYMDVENLKRDKATLENDMLSANKHISYLEEVKANKDREIAEKEEAIKGLDLQLTDKAARRDNLEHEVNEFETALITKREELASLLVKIADHQKYIDESSETIKDLHDRAHANHAKAADKLAKILALVNDLKD